MPSLASPDSDTLSTAASQEGTSTHSNYAKGDPSWDKPGASWHS
jgi:hypothetical protein